MNNGFDFDKIGKRMPYTVPEEFFDTMENNLLDKVKASSAGGCAPRRRHRRIVLRLIASAAVAIALAFMVETMFFSRDRVEYSDVEQAFNNLSSDDRDYMIALYQDDIFINE